MKKWISLLFAGILVSAFMVGCSGDATTDDTTTPPPTTTDTE